MVPQGEKKNIYIHYLRGRLCENGNSHPLFYGLFMWNVYFESYDIPRAFDEIYHCLMRAIRLCGRMSLN